MEVSLHGENNYIESARYVLDCEGVVGILKRKITGEVPRYITTTTVVLERTQRERKPKHKREGRLCFAPELGDFVSNNGVVEFYLLDVDADTLYKTSLELSQDESIRGAVSDGKNICISILDERDTESFTTKKEGTERLTI